jgi:hypothetical protein
VNTSYAGEIIVCHSSNRFHWIFPLEGIKISRIQLKNSIALRVGGDDCSLQKLADVIPAVGLNNSQHFIENLALQFVFVELLKVLQHASVMLTGVGLPNGQHQILKL